MRAEEAALVKEMVAIAHVINESDGAIYEILQRLDMPGPDSLSPVDIQQELEGAWRRDQMALLDTRETVLKQMNSAFEEILLQPLQDLHETLSTKAELLKGTVDHATDLRDELDDIHSCLTNAQAHDTPVHDENIEEPTLVEQQLIELLKEHEDLRPRDVPPLDLLDDNDLLTELGTLVEQNRNLEKVGQHWVSTLAVHLNRLIVCNIMTGVVPAFHGYAHNRPCQTGYHPKYREGVGIEDFEGCERINSLSNQYASTTRLTTRFHRRQTYQEFMDFNDEDKFASSADFIYQNYRQAVEHIARNLHVFEELCKTLKISPADCESFLEMEIQYFKTPSTLSEDLDKEEEYVNLLQKLWAAEKASTTAHTEWKKLGTPSAHGWTDKQIRRVKARNTSTFTNLGTIQEQVACFEDDHGIYPRWNSFDPEFLTAQDHIREAEYRRAVDELHHSVAARLLEMSKLSASGLCYKQRDKITNALKARAGAVRSALDRHNAAAAKVKGRGPILWDDVVKMVSLADLDYLKDTRLNIQTVPWAKPENRNAMELHFGLERAKEEINRLNVEIKRLISFMIDDEADFWLAIDEIATGDTQPTQEQLDFRVYLQREYRRRKAVHWRMAERLLLISKLPGFSGDLIPGHRVDRGTFKSALAPLPEWASQVLGISREPLAWESDSPPAYSSSAVSGGSSMEGEILELFNERGIEPEHLVTFMEKVALE
ncbi:hypothetical protein VNI00_011729 [Paramarasmius palmivorus]|uniref:Uncharacterized protein n=1 Tax=Paramarasmius palmivorus TaxID=297713 RepID=A0AAW0CBX6_9AGAR